ncbi:MAG: hypothetical protein K6C08_14460 [Oscillospiraceae bacterium]|nr:hypothetical protein [Oscillospiraceae bacterium]
MIRYLADMHFDDEAIIAYDNRPFNSVREMNDCLIDRWNAVVLPEDLTCILGDFCRGSSDRWRELLLSLNGRKILITGNHDDPLAVESVQNLLECSAAYLELEDEGRPVVLCHYPISAFRDHYFGWIHLYGHVHCSYEWNITENTKRLIRNLYARQDVCRMANVGAMLSYMDYAPRTLEELSAQL